MTTQPSYTVRLTDPYSAAAMQMTAMSLYVQRSRAAAKAL